MNWSLYGPYLQKGPSFAHLIEMIAFLHTDWEVLLRKRVGSKAHVVRAGSTIGEQKILADYV